MAEELSEEIIEPIPFEALEVNSALRYTIFTKKNDTYNIYLQRGKRFGMGEKTKLKSQRVDYVYIKQQNKILFLEDVLKNLDEVDKKVKSKDAMVAIYYDLLDLQVKEIFKKGIEKENIEQIRKFIAKIVDLVLSGSSCVAKLINIIEEHSTKYQHSMNVMVYSLILGKMLSLKQDQLEILSFGALFHDVSKIEKDFDENKHPLRGVEILKEHGIDDVVVNRIVSEHHEYLDGSGTPNALGADKISRFSQIVTITNTFDNLCSTERENLSTFEALKYMKSKMLSKLNETALHSFIILFKQQRS